MFGWWHELPKQIFSSSDEIDFVRLRTQNFTLNQQYILDGIGFVMTWRIDSIANDSSQYVEFTVPAGYYMAIDNRILNTSAELTVYRVYPEGTFTVDSELTDNDTTFVKTRNLRGDATLNPSVARRVTVTTPPDPGDQIIFVDQFGDSGIGSTQVGAVSNENTFLLLEPDQKFLLELQNNGSGPESINFRLTYAFIPESLVSASKF